MVCLCAERKYNMVLRKHGSGRGLPTLYTNKHISCNEQVGMLLIKDSVILVFGHLEWNTVEILMCAPLD